MISWRISSQIEHVGSLGEKVRAACTGFGLDSEAAGEVELSVVEIVNNAIEHGYQRSDAGWVEVSMASNGQQLHIEVSDGGRAMPPGLLATASMPPVDPERRDTLPEGGMGLSIVKELMDDVRYESTATRNTLIMERRIARP